jgi:hypothetical protein
MAGESLEQRVAALEAELDRVKQLIGQKKLAPWWQLWAGAFRNDPYFEKAMKYGRQYRESLRPKNASKHKKKNGPS